MKIVVLEKSSLGANVNLDELSALGEVTYYDATLPEEVAQRADGADILVINKLKMNAHTLQGVKGLKFITITSTGIDNFDLPYCKEKNIVISNMRGYSTQSVAQQTFALALYLLNRMEYFPDFVRSGDYINNTSGDYYQTPTHEIYGKTWGIIGLGKIGSMVADIAAAFGANVIYCSLSGNDRGAKYKRVALEELLKRADIVSIHSPLSDASRGLVNKQNLSKMKKSAILLNLGRGPIVVEKDLAQAIQCGVIAGAGLDVLDGEPMKENSPLIPLLGDPRLVITPHVGWASEESRQRAVDEVVMNIKAFQEGAPRNCCW